MKQQELYLEFRKQALLDLSAMKNLFKVKDYGNSAYHAQQSMEKLIKAILLQDNPETNVKNMGHIVCSKKLLEHFQTRINDIGKSDLDYWQEHSSMIDNLFCILIDTSEDSNKFKTEWWLYSLGFDKFEGDSSFESGFKQLANMGMKIAPPLVLALISPLWKLYRAQSDQHEDNQVRINKILSYRDEYIEKFNESDPTTRLCDKILKMLPDDMPKSDTIVYKIVSVLNVSGLLLKLYPHEVMGRYPEMINGVSSLNIYDYLHEDLAVLEQEVEYTFKELDIMFFQTS